MARMEIREDEKSSFTYLNNKKYTYNGYKPIRDFDYIHVLTYYSFRELL